MDESAIKSTLYDWLKRELGVRQTFTITFNADLISGNIINGTFDGEAIDAVTFTGTHAATMTLLAAAIQSLDIIFKATVTAARVITCIAFEPGQTITAVGPTVTSGASQAVATVVQTVEPQDVTVIFSDQNAPRPVDYPYAVIRLDSIIQLGYDEVREIDVDTNLATIGGQRRATVNIDYFGPRPMENIMKAFNSLEKRSLNDIFYDAGIAYTEKNDVKNLTAMLETKYEERASFDFYIGFAENFEDDLGVIESVEFTGSVTRDSGDLDIDSVTVGPILIDS